MPTETEVRQPAPPCCLCRQSMELESAEDIIICDDCTETFETLFDDEPVEG